PIQKYWPAEDYHQDYFLQNPNQGYCSFVVGPKVQKFQKAFTRWLKD
ncbi:MAG: peptide-methionine (S)-S-oxide reductase, partial [Comamonas sp.]